MATKRTPPPKRPRDPWLLARQIGQIATGEVEDPLKSNPKKDPAAVRLGRKGGIASAEARKTKIPPERRKEIARKAAISRWTRTSPK